MYITKKHLSRRTVLKGLGTSLALPFLGAMTPAFAQPKQPLRFGAIYLPNGVYPQLWHPDTAGRDFEFKLVMKPLEPFRDYLTTISRLKATEGTKDAGGIHMGASAAFLNGVGPLGKNGEFNRIESAKTIDQYIADMVAGDTPLRSLEVGTEDMGTSAGACDGYPCVFFNTISWADANTPLPVSINPQATFERMFGDPGTSQQRVARLHAKQSMLDSVLEETRRLQKMIGAEDNRLLDEYLTNVRRVEEQLERMNPRVDTLADIDVTSPIGIPDFDEHMTVTYDLMHLAYQTDMSRVFTFMLGHEASGRSYQFIGVKEPHHSTSHHKNTPESIDQYARIGAYHMVKFAEFLGKLQSTPDGDGNLLDSSYV